MKIYGLTVTQPWAFGFALGKRLENRNWTPPTGFGSFYIALHSGKFPREKHPVPAYNDLDFLLNRIQPSLENENKILQKSPCGGFRGLYEILPTICLTTTRVR